MKSMRALIAITLVTVAIAELPLHSADTSDDTKPSITITKMPSGPPGEDSPLLPIRGKVSGVKPSECKVVVFAYGDMWYVQPFADEPITDVEKDLTWETQTRGGFEFAALLVKPSFKPPQKPLRALPKVGGEILAIAREKPKKE